MQIHTLFAGYPVIRVAGQQAAEVTNVTYDSRKVRTSSLFVCIEGYVQDGHDFIEEAIEKGATAIVVQKEVDLPKRCQCALIRVADSRQALAYISSRYFHMPSRKLKMVAATGAAGKHTFSYLLYSLLRRRGESCGMINGMETWVSDRVVYQTRNHPGALEIQRSAGHHAAK